MNSFGLDFINFLFSLFNIMFAFMTGFLVTLIVTSFIKLIFKIKLKLKRISLYGGIIYFIVFIVVSINITYNIKKTEYDITAQSNFKNSNEYNIALIADLHYSSVTLNERYLKEICNDVSNENPDIVMLCGDIVDENTTYEEMVMVFDNLSQIESKYGIYFVFGNHDAQYKLKESYRKYTIDQLKKAIVDSGIIVLEDNYTIINDDIILIGRDTEHNTDRLPLDSFEEALNDNRYKIVMSHEPIDYAESDEYDLGLSAHTHNGQVWPFNLVLSIKYRNKLLYGLEETENFTYIVTSGIGTWAFPIRNTAPSEYVIINIKESS